MICTSIIQDWNLSGRKYNLHKIIDYTIINNTFNRQRFHFRGKYIHIHGSDALGEIKVEEMKRQNKTMKKNVNTGCY